MDGLPFLPGNTFNDPTKSRYHKTHSLIYNNGYAQHRRPEVGIGGVAIAPNQLNEAELDELLAYKPELTYGQAKQPAPEPFVPAHAMWDKKVMKFYGWFKQTVHESQDETHRVRHVQLYYYLEDDSIAVIEPHVENSGLPQGKLIKRQRLPKNNVGDHWHWKDLNIGVNVVFYGKVFHIYDCDKWTKDFLESEGVVVSPTEEFPKDSYLNSRETKAQLRSFKTPSDFDKLRQFLEMDRKVLRYYCVWDDRENMFGELRKFVLHYYLVDDTLEIREVYTNNNGRDPFPVLITRHKVPKNRFDMPSTFPSIVLEQTDQEIKDYYTPRDFMIGKTVIIYNRNFLIYGFDNFTKAFYWKNFNITEFPEIDVEVQKPELAKMEIPPYNGYGTLEDSLQSCMTLIPQPPNKDFIKMLENDGKVLRYECKLDSHKPEDVGRRFILHYRLADDMCTIYEPPVRNSGQLGGKYLERTRLAKPGSNANSQTFYGPGDFYIGATVFVFNHRFIIVGADAFVLKYLEAAGDYFPRETCENIKEYVTQNQPAQKDHTVYSDADLRELVLEMKGQLKKMSITGNHRIDHIFLSYDLQRQGFLNKDNLRVMCERQHLPAHPAVIDRLAAEMNPVDPDHISLEDLRYFLESG
jgi:hypothetical protein